MARLIRHDEIFVTDYGQRLILGQLSARSLVSSLDRHEPLPHLHNRPQCCSVKTHSHATLPECNL